MLQIKISCLYHSLVIEKTWNLTREFFFSNVFFVSRHGAYVSGKGILMQHKSTKKWIIGVKPEDVNAQEIGGCTDGPTVIDFKNKIYSKC